MYIYQAPQLTYSLKLSRKQHKMGGLDGYFPVMVMIGLQFHYSLLAIFTRAALLDGLIPTVFVVYRQGIATLALAPIIFSSNKRYIYIYIYIMIDWIKLNFPHLTNYSHSSY